MAQNPVVITAEKRSVMVVSAGRQGVPGAPGASGAAETQYVTAENISGERVVYVDSAGKVRYASHADTDHLLQIAGVSTQAGLLGATINVRASGLQESNSWNWTPDLPVFLGAGGVLTQTPPATGGLVTIGAAISATSIFIRIGRPIWRA